jgi:hypothetical protein
MALVNCGECGRQVSDKAQACPQCGAPVADTVPERPPGVPPNWKQELAAMKAEEVTKKKTRPIFLVILGVFAAGAFIVYRAATNEKAAPPSAGLRGAFRQPQKVVSERASLKEGQAMMYAFELRSDARVEVEVHAQPKSVSVMLMTAAELEKFRKAMGELFGGKYTYRQALSRQAVLQMKDTEMLPAGSWAIVIQRPRESLLFGDDTAAAIDVTVY